MSRDSILPASSGESIVDPILSVLWGESGSLGSELSSEEGEGLLLLTGVVKDEGWNTYMLIIIWSLNTNINNSAHKNACANRFLFFVFEKNGLGTGVIEVIDRI
jgi:hypothetical protein